MLAIKIAIDINDKGRGAVDVGGVDVPLEEIGNQVQFITMADEITCEICMAHHGEVNDANDMSRPIPPLHRRCRCIEQPYIDGVSPPQQPKFGAMREFIRGAAAMQAAWSATQLEDYRKALLGVGVADLLAKKKITLDDILTPTHERRTLKEIKKSIA